MRKNSPRRPAVQDVFRIDVAQDEKRESLLISADDPNLVAETSPRRRVAPVPLQLDKQTKVLLKVTVLNLRDIEGGQGKSFFVGVSDGTCEHTTKIVKGAKDYAFTQTFLFSGFRSLDSLVFRVCSSRKRLLQRVDEPYARVVVPSEDINTAIAEKGRLCLFLYELPPPKSGKLAVTIAAVDENASSDGNGKNNARRQRGATQVSNFGVVSQDCALKRSLLACRVAAKARPVESNSKEYPPPQVAELLEKDLELSEGETAEIERWVLNAPFSEWGGVTLPALKHRNARGRSLLHILAAKGRVEGVKRLLEMRADPNMKDFEEKTVLHLSIQHCPEDALEKIVDAVLEGGLADLEIVGSQGFSLAIFCCVFGRNLILSKLLEFGCNPDVQSECGATACAVSAFLGRSDCLQTLLRFNANANVEDLESNSPLLHALVEGRSDCAVILIESGCDPNSVSVSGRSPLWIAISRRLDQLAEKLLDMTSTPKVDLETPLGSHRWTVLMRVVLELDDATVSHYVPLLLKHGASLDSQNDEEKTALFFAVKGKKRPQIVAQLIKPKEQIADCNDNTPLHFVGDSVEVANLLLENGFSPNAKNKQGNTPLHVAYALGHHQLVHFLLSNGARNDISNKNGHAPSECIGVGVDFAFPFFAEERSIKELGGVFVKDFEAKKN